MVNITKKELEFDDELNQFITLIQYDEEEVYNELNEAMQKTMSSLHRLK